MQKTLLRALTALFAFACLVFAGFVTPALAGGTFTVINNFAETSNNDIVHVYVYRNSPGSDQFKSGGYIVPGDHVEFRTSISGCTGFKLKLGFRDGTSEIYRNIDVCDSVYAVDEDGIRLTILSVDDIHISNRSLNRSISIDNNYDSSLTEVYATNTGDGSWGDDLLSGRILAGDTRRLELDDGSGLCAFDIKVVANDGSDWIMWDFNVCSETKLYIPF